MPLPGGTRLGPYDIVAPLGQGGMGEVYRAHDAKLNRTVAIKILPEAFAADADRVARFQREAKTLAALNHPNIAQIFGLEQAGDVHALAMEFVAGEDLADRIAQGPLSFGDALPIARQIAEALEAAHDQGIVHRDLKPANIKVRPDGTVKLLDFGLAKAIEGAGGAGRAGKAGAENLTESPTITSPAFTQVGMIIGTAAYMSPEQARGKPADQRSDIWAFGVVLAEMVSGRRLFDGETISDTIAAVLTREPDLDGVPPALRRLIRLCLARDPRQRLRHIGDALALVDDSPATATPDRARRAWPWVSMAAAIVLAVVAVAVTQSLRPRVVNDEVTKFYVDAPPGAAFNYTYTAASISPD